MGEEGVDIDTSANTGDHGAENHIDISVKLEDDGRYSGIPRIFLF